MNKNKKLAFAAVSLVMAGTMAFSITACGPSEGTGGGGGGGNGGLVSADKYGVLKEDGSLNYSVYEDRGNVTLNIAIGHENDVTGTVFKDLGAAITLPDGKPYNSDDLKPAWAQMGKDLNITWVNKWQGSKTSANLSDLQAIDPATGEKIYAGVDMFTSDLSKVVDASTQGTDILNLADYLDYMPNFTKFLNENPIVALSLLQYGMQSDGTGMTLFVAPYFDGYNDIERYCIVRHDWAKKLLNGETELSGGSQWGKGTDVEPFFTTDYEIDSLTKDGNGTQKIKKDYAAAKAAAADDSTPLGAAYKAIANAAYTGTSGNIVAIMNAAIAANNNATGPQLVNLYRAYIDAAYKVGTAAAYAKDSRADLFIGYDAAWDVDDLVAMLRCVLTNASSLNVGSHTIGGIMPRSGQNDRTPDMVRLASQLYGVRGADSRLEYSYIDADGNLQDARNDAAFYQAQVNMNKLKKEGLVADYSGIAAFTGGSGVTTKPDGNEYFLMYDFSQTQTLNGFYKEDVTLEAPSSGIANDKSGYYFAPILTPVSQWSVKGDKDTIMRFTESWRSTKTGGLAVNGSVKNDANKLKAVLQFIDYLYSEDGQIVSTFGPMASDANGTGGFWYNEEAAAGATDTFKYKGKTYKGYKYKDVYTPTITDALYESFKGNDAVTKNETVAKAKLSFTNYARYLIGSTLPVGVKNQSFENQLTSEMGQAGAGVVGAALKAGVIKGMSLKVDENNYWYTAVPTGLPIRAAANEQLGNSNMTTLKYMSGEAADSKNNPKNYLSVFNWIILNGLGSHYNSNSVEYDIPATVADLVTYMSETRLAQSRETIWNAAWGTAKEYWNYIK